MAYSGGDRVIIEQSDGCIAWLHIMMNAVYNKTYGT